MPEPTAPQIQTMPVAQDQLTVIVTYSAGNPVPHVAIEAVRNTFVNAAGAPLPAPIQDYLSPLGVLTVCHQVQAMAMNGLNAQITELNSKANPSGLIIPGGR